VAAIGSPLERHRNCDERGDPTGVQGRRIGFEQSCSQNSVMPRLTVEDSLDLYAYWQKVLLSKVIAVELSNLYR
jgi:hypothetical protein